MVGAGPLSYMANTLGMMLGFALIIASGFLGLFIDMRKSESMSGSAGWLLGACAGIIGIALTVLVK